MTPEEKHKILAEIIELAHFGHEHGYERAAEATAAIIKLLGWVSPVIAKYLVSQQIAPSTESDEG